jgi:phosphate transport system protein
MTRYEKRLQKDVETIIGQVVAVAADIDMAVKKAVHALLTTDVDLAYATILGDHAINRQVREIDRRCHVFVARHLPSAGHLRMVSAVLRISRELERIGDYAATISRETAQFERTPPPSVARDIELLAEQSRRMLTQSIKSLSEANADLARGTAVIENQIDATFDKVISDLLAEEGERSLQDLFGHLVVLNRLERISDRAKNICEEVVFWITGVGKAPKVFRILFLDQRNGCVSQMAEAVARKAYPEGGRYASAGLDPAEEINEHVVAYMENLGCDLDDQFPKPFRTSHDVLSDYHVVVGLGLSPRDHIPEVPFHTVLLRWDVGDCPRSEEDTGEVYRSLAHEITELMETLHGEGAS